ncbi:hypothetical protein ASC87_06980 [Rhizobacter sp. Root1221]|nr:hypothetical protein ASC87_06980 [Rhizobacter sp. Root1221]
MSEVQSKERRLLSPEGGTAGPLKSRVLQRDLLQREQAAFLFTFAQAEVFRSWWRDTLVFGGCWFGAHWPLPQGVPEGAYRFRRFVGTPTWSEFLPGVGWNVTAVLEVRGLGTPEVTGGGGGDFAMGWCDPVQEMDVATPAQSNSGTLPDENNGGNALCGGIVGGAGALADVEFTLVSWVPIIEADDPPEVGNRTDPGFLGMFDLEWFLHRDPEFNFITAISGGVAKVSATVGGVACPGLLQATCIPTYFEGEWNGYANIEWLWVAS